MLKDQFKQIKRAKSATEFCRNQGTWNRLALGMALIFAMLAWSSVSMAQLAGQGAIQGRVTDPSGAIVRNATVTATNVATAVKTMRTTTGAGIYVISPIPAGEYTVTVSAPGFATEVQEHIVVDATKSVGLDLKLSIGTQTEQITVSDAPPALETTNATLGETMENKTYSALPLSMGGQQRDPTAFIYLMPGVQGGGRSGTFNGEGSNNGYLDEMYVDGIPLTTISQQGDNRTVSLALSVDAVDQFQVITSGASAQYQGMGVQNFNIKSGTTPYHGAAVDLIRNTMFDSGGCFAKAATAKNAAGQTVPAPKPGEHQNELALTLGGPVRIPHLYDGRDKLFFFVSYDKYHATAGANPNLLSVPSLAERAGNFQELPYKIYDPTTLASCTAANGGIPCTNQFHALVNGVDTPNVIPTSEISPMTQYMEKFLPAPTSTTSDQGNLLTGQPSGANNWELTAKVDYQMTPKQRLSILSNSGRRGFIGLDFGSSSVLPPPYTNAVLVAEVTATGILEHNYVLTDHMVNNLKYAYVRQWGPAGNPWMNIPQYEAASAIGITNLPQGQASLTFPNVTFSSFADNPSNWTSYKGYSQTVNTYDIMDNLQWTRGKHNFTFGFLYQWLSENESNWDTPSTPLGLNFANATTSGYDAAGKVQNTKTGNSFASFMVGAVEGSGVSVQPFSVLGARYHAFSPNVQDDWRVTSKLTLNLGLRWDMYTPFNEVLDRWSYLNMKMTNPATGSLGAIEFVGNGSDSCHCRTPVNMYWGNLGPRLGLAYSVNDKTVIRAAFSTVYSHGGGVGGRAGAQHGSGQTGLIGSAAFPSSGQAGAIPAFYLNPNLPAPYAGTGLPAYSATPFRDPTVNAGNYINGAGKAITPQGVEYPDPYLSGRAPYAESWNFGVERAITRDLTLSVNYSASQSHFLSGGNRGIIRNSLDPKYEVLGNLLKQLPGNVDKTTGKTFLQDAQAILPGINIPYVNFGGPNATILAMLLPHPQYGGINDIYGNVGNANYNSLQLSLAQRTRHGVSFNLNYTYSKEIDNTGSFRTGYAIPASAVTDGIARPQNALDRSLGSGETPQLLRAFGVWELPFGKGHMGGDNRLVSALASGWALSGIFSYNSGAPLEITTGGCAAIGQGTCMPSYTPGYSKSPRINGGWGKGITPATAGSHPFLDASAFTSPNETYQVGNVVRNGAYGLFGPGGFDLDSSLRRSFKIKDNVVFIFQADSFNVTNAVHFRIGSTTVTPTKVVAGQTVNSIGTNTGSNFGTISGQSNSARDWQFSGRINF